MEKMSPFQLKCLITLLIIPVAFLEEGPLLTAPLKNNAWLAPVVMILLGWFLFQMYLFIFRQNNCSFPEALTEHLGNIVGKIITVFYIFYFLLLGGYVLRIYSEFMKTSLLLTTPSGVPLFLMLFTGFYALKKGINNIARISVIILALIILFNIFLISNCLINGFKWDNLQPLLSDISVKTSFIAFFGLTGVLGKAMAVFILADFIEGDKEKSIRASLNTLLFIFVPVISSTLLALSATLHPAVISSLSSAVFTMARTVHISYFIQNIDVLFISVWICGIYVTLTLFWFSASICTQKAFKLPDNRFFLAASGVFIALVSVFLSGTSLGLSVWTTKLMPFLNNCFFIFIPLFIFIKVLIKKCLSNGFAKRCPFIRKRNKNSFIAKD
ncbi:MAG: GerAB/ArcD/ProY family transporter [Syntrophomonadaceae bacterium]|jgi:spore germination protein KB|nr:GerAB/ArcD/ProY family transporter [Syntrophomonadaceae bacterium]